ncbi:MAG: leucine-rich repeat protein [Lachnospiraceae bacterium]|nr:leucine-rich repeat protein [Lachnospiraceae bacterium]
MSTNMIASENSGVSLLSSSSDLVSGDYTYTISGNKATITGYTGSSSVISIPSNIGEYTVTGIGYNAFKSNSVLKSIIFPNTITSIGGSAFQNCTALKTVTMSYNNTVEYAASIGGNAFSGCTSLTDIWLSENVTSISDQAFSGCTALKKLTLPQSLRSVGYRIIESTAISSITIPKNVTSSNGVSSYGALANCKSLTEVIFEDGMTKIPGYICASGSYTSYITKVVIPESVTEIGYNALYKCINITIYGYTNSYAETYANENNIPFMDIGEMESGGYDSYVVGSLSSIDALGGTATINGTAYDVSEDLDISSATALLYSDCKTVIALKKDDVLITLDGVKNVIDPKVELHLVATKAVYQNGAFENPSFNIQVDETVSVKKPYSKNMLSGVEDAGITFSSLKLTNKENFAKISELNSSKKKYSLELKLNETVKPGGKAYQDFVVDIDADYIPDSTNSTMTFEGTVGSNAGENTDTKTLPVGNLDIAKAKRQQNTSVEDAKNALNGSSNARIAFSLGNMSGEIPTSEIPNLEKCITAWASDIMAARSLVADDQTGIISKIKKQAKKSEDELVSKVLAAAGINDGIFTKWTNTRATTQIKTKNKKGNEITLYVTFDMGYSAFKDDAPYGGLGKITVLLEEPYKMTGTGIVTYTDMTVFVDKLKSVAESSIAGVYDAAWGNNADKVAEIFVGETITKITKSFGYSFSGGIFNLITKPGKTITKSVGTHCPVDVYVYDSQGKLRGSIVNNEVVQTDDELFLYVDGDEKYVYVMNDDYTFKLVGFDEGKMDYDVTTYVDGEVERIIEYKDIPLKNNVAYYGYVPENAYNANLLYDLVAEEGDTLPADSDNYEGTYQIFTESISLNNESLKLNIGDKRTLSATVLPNNTTNGLLYWTSSDDKIAKVDETTGEVEAIAKGVVTITATTLDGLSAECAVEVMAEDGYFGNETPKPTDKPNLTTSSKPTHKPDVAGTPEPTDKPNATENPDSTDGINTTNSPLKGTVLKDKKNKMAYKVIEQGKTVAFYKVDNKKVTKIIIPSTVLLNGIKYKVTAISDNAFNGCKKLKSVTIGKFVTTIGNKAFFKCTAFKKITIPASVTKIGKKAFYGCKKLKSITIKTKKMKSKSVGTQAFKGIYKKAVVKVPKKQKNAYQKWLRKKGITKKMKIK